METLKELRRLAKELEKSPVPRASREWGGADVVVSRNEPPEQSEGGFYPAPRYVITPQALELSWLFEQLRDAFYSEKMIDSCSKIEFFGRLANAATRCIGRSSTATARLICAAVLHEAYAIHDEMDEGVFECLSVASGNEIADDHIDEALKTGYLGVDATLAFFRSRGLELHND